MGRRCVYLYRVNAYMLVVQKLGAVEAWPPPSIDLYLPLATCLYHLRSDRRSWGASFAAEVIATTRTLQISRFSTHPSLIGMGMPGQEQNLHFRLRMSGIEFVDEALEALPICAFANVVIGIWLGDEAKSFESSLVGVNIFLLIL